MRTHQAVFALCLSLASGLGMAPVAAQDGAPINVNVNMARVLRINASAATVIVGNPGIADVTIQDPKTLILTGKSFGQTNLIVLDNAGNPIADTIIEVVQMQAGVTTVYQGQARTSIACAPVCQNIIMMGDDPAFSGQAVASSSIMSSMGN
ncbi:pilus assembly protein N-terminal domain-containing protein [Devosia beringensis]|uniref:pilus assembly protein N-terminal domain-containing protein n=1 Tax=Devosia beringensis TaxID=2657486 RepID=UPI00186B9C01|nr:pilus assembly protein N-terminal domain-containing protein [Devosia beringensis]